MKNMFMVEVSLPKGLSPQLVSKIPHQRMHINEMMQRGTISSYTLAMNRSKLWVCVSADNPQEVDDVISDFPIADFITYKINELAFHDTAHSLIHEFSLN